VDDLSDAEADLWNRAYDLGYEQGLKDAWLEDRPDREATNDDEEDE
jgi:hypothetical protein